MKELIAIQVELKAPKNQKNNFGNYNYRNCEDILEALKPLLHKYQVVLTITDEIVQIGNYIFVKATVTIASIGGDRSISATAFARHPENQKGMNDSQLTGSASSYARKYALNGLFCIDDNKDADEINKGGNGNKIEPKTFDSLLPPQTTGTIQQPIIAMPRTKQ